MNMTIKKTSIGVEETIWNDWLAYAVKKKGSARKVGELSGEAFKEYMKSHPIEG